MHPHRALGMRSPRQFIGAHQPARHEADRTGEGERLVCGEAAAVVGEPLHRLLRSELAGAALDGNQHA